MKRAIVICNGNLSNIEKVTFLKSDFIICADGAVEKILNRNIFPSVVIGDFDSTPKKIVESLIDMKIPLIKYPVKKDQTDSELAIDYAVKKKYKNIIVCGLLGDRIDHLLGNIFHISNLAQTGHDITIIENKTIAYTVHKKIIIAGQKKDLISLIPLTKKVERITTSGLYYSLKNETIEFGTTRGVSNYMIGAKATIDIKSGILLVTHTQS